MRTLRHVEVKQLAPGPHFIPIFELNKETKECQKRLHDHRTSEWSSLDADPGSVGPRPVLKPLSKA